MGSCECSNDPSGCTRGREYLYQLNSVSQKNIILCEFNYEVQYDDIFIKATNIISDANLSSGSEVDTDSKDGETCQDAYCNLQKCAICQDCKI